MASDNLIRRVVIRFVCVVLLLTPVLAQAPKNWTTAEDHQDYRTEKMPGVNVGLLDGQLAWRQHDGGHTDAPNWKYFIPWANRMLEP